MSFTFDTFMGGAVDFGTLTSNVNASEFHRCQRFAPNNGSRKVIMPTKYRRGIISGADLYFFWNDSSFTLTLNDPEDGKGDFHTMAANEIAVLHLVPEDYYPVGGPFSVAFMPDTSLTRIWRVSGGLST